MKSPAPHIFFKKSLARSEEKETSKAEQRKCGCSAPQHDQSSGHQIKHLALRKFFRVVATKMPSVMMMVMVTDRVIRELLRKKMMTMMTMVMTMMVLRLIMMTTTMMMIGVTGRVIRMRTVVQEE